MSLISVLELEYPQSEFLHQWAQELQTQDNAGTSQPIYFVYEEIRGKGHSTSKFFFTRKAAEGYINSERHNLTKPYIYVHSASGNEELKMIMGILVNSILGIKAKGWSL